MKIPNHLVSRKQAIALKKVGYNNPCSYYLLYTLERNPISGKRYNCLARSYPTNWNKEESFISVPSVYDAIDWLSTVLKRNKKIYAFDYIGYIYINPIKKERYKELRNLIDDKIKILISSRKKSAKSKKPKRLSKSWKQTKN